MPKAKKVPFANINVALRYYAAEGFEIGQMRCLKCEREQFVVQFPGVKKRPCMYCQHTLNAYRRIKMP